MKRHIHLVIFGCAALFLASSWRPQKTGADDFRFNSLGEIPVLVGGRLKPLDTVARNSLVIMRGRQTLRHENGQRVEAMQWLTDVLLNAPVADGQPTFAIHHPDVLGLFGWQQDDKKYFTYAALEPFLRQIDEQGQQAEKVESPQRTPYHVAIINLRNSLILYQRLKNSIQPERATDFAQEIDAYSSALPEFREAADLKTAGKPFDKNKLELASSFADRYEDLATMAYVLAIPPAKSTPHATADWISAGQSLLIAQTTGNISPVLKAYALLGDAYRAGDAQLFNQRVSDLQAWMEQNEPRAAGRGWYEQLFNFLAPFYVSMSIYVLAFLLACFSWLGWGPELRRAAVWLLMLALVIHTFGLVSRMVLQERPPVTNLYSSAIFIGWGTVIIGLILERIYRDGIGAACAGAIGFITLIIAHNLAGSGDTLEMLQAVLDTNIWLATHVVVVTAGYSAMFLAGMLAIIYVLRGVLTRSLDNRTAQALTRMTYGVICFATLFSFVGTVLGGIWADQSWGRFWGWDPKENGALLIVLWCAIMLHARWGGFIKQRGLMVMALFGNVITSFSWFGVNMLGVGLHSYGFMNKAFPWLAGFMLSQLALMAIAGLPLERWRSFQKARAPVAEEEAVAVS
jgi:ABC-type transport system involved in cytochrome c biogenesis permease subunit